MRQARQAKQTRQGRQASQAKQPRQARQKTTKLKRRNPKASQVKARKGRSKANKQGKTASQARTNGRPARPSYMRILIYNCMYRRTLANKRSYMYVNDSGWHSMVRTKLSRNLRRAFLLENSKPLQREPLVTRCGAVVRRAIDAKSTQEQFHADL